MIYVPEYKTIEYTSTDIKKMLDSDFNKIATSSYKNEKILKNRFKEQLDGYINLIDLKNILFFKPSKIQTYDNYIINNSEIETLKKIFDNKNTKTISLADAINLHYKINPHLLKIFNSTFFNPIDLYTPNVGLVLNLFKMVVDSFEKILSYSNYNDLYYESNMELDKNFKSYIYIKNMHVYNSNKDYNIHITNNILNTVNNIYNTSISKLGISNKYYAGTYISKHYDLIINTHVLNFNNFNKNVIKKWQKLNEFNNKILHNKFSCTVCNNTTTTNNNKIPETIRLLLVNNSLLIAFSGFIFIIPEFDSVTKNIDQKLNKPVNIVYGKLNAENIFIDTKATGYVLSYFHKI